MKISYTQKRMNRIESICKVMSVMNKYSELCELMESLSPDEYRMLIKSLEATLEEMQSD